MIQWKWYIIILSPLWASAWYGRRERLIRSQKLRPGHTLCLTSLGVREGFIYFSLLLFVQQLLDSTSRWQEWRSSLSFTDSAFFQSYVSCFAFLWPSELFSSGPSCCRSGDELSCTIRKILTKWHRLFTAPHHIIITCVTAPLFAWPLLDVLSDSHLYGT